MKKANTQPLAAGLTLLEVLIAGLLVSVLAVVAAVSLNRSNTAMHESNSITDAQTIANNEVERLREEAYAGGTLCAADPQAEPVQLNGVTYHPSVTLRFLFEDSGNNNEEVDCSLARSARVDVTVTWTAPSGDDTLHHELATTISAFDLQAPTFNALSRDHVRLAQGQVIEWGWNEGDTLPIPEYTLVVPSDEFGSGFELDWNGPATWVNGPEEKQINLEVPPHFELSQTVDRERENTLRFTALRNGTHYLNARNVVGEAAPAVLDANVVQHPLHEYNIPAAIRYGDSPDIEVRVTHDGFDEEDLKVTVRDYKPDNPWVETRSNAEITIGALETFTPDFANRPLDFPAKYSVAVDNLYTITYPNPVPETSEVQCFGPLIDESRIQRASPIYEHEEYAVTIPVLPNNVPDLVIDGRINDNKEAWVGSNPYPGHGVGEQNIVLRAVAGAAGTTERWVVTATSEECGYYAPGDENKWEATFEVTPIPVPSDPPNLASISVNIGGTAPAYGKSPTVSITRSISNLASGSINFPKADGGYARFTGNYTLDPPAGTETLAGIKGYSYSGTATLVQEYEYVYNGRTHTGTMVTATAMVTGYTLPDDWFPEPEEEAEPETPGPGTGEETEPGEGEGNNPEDPGGTEDPGDPHTPNPGEACVPIELCDF